MDHREKIDTLRKIMVREKLDAYIVSGTDPHNSEYLPEVWQQRKWISGFSGSAGTIVITGDKIGLWTDSRYFIQAEQELIGTGIHLFKMKQPGVPDFPVWLKNEMPEENARIGFDGFCTPLYEYNLLKSVLGENVQLIETDLLGEIWLDRPALPEVPMYLYPEELAGESCESKLTWIRQYLYDQNKDFIFLSVLDEIAWLYNIRGNDIPYNPLVISYAVVGKECAFLFVKRGKVSPEDQTRLESQGITLMDYHHITLFLEELDEKYTFLVDDTTLNYALYNRINRKFSTLLCPSPIPLRKSIKNKVEIEGQKQACLNDGVALCRFFYWLETHLGTEKLTESKVALKLQEFRQSNKDYLCDSFHTISAYGINAALPHYSYKGEGDELLRKGLYLVDSGGQYKYGTTDITRTISLGELTDTEKEDYTLVFKGMVRLSLLHFPKGVSGGNIDVVARMALWNKMKNYGHGTGHGVGHFLCVHEGPQDIRQNLKNQPFQPGMITSNEPGMYVEGKYGIRHENLILCVHCGENEHGEWLGFETLTLCYFDTSALKIELLDKQERDWLNQYHKTVYEKISPLLNTDEARWLKGKTGKI